MVKKQAINKTDGSSPVVLLAARSWWLPQARNCSALELFKKFPIVEVN